MGGLQEYGQGVRGKGRPQPMPMPTLKETKRRNLVNVEATWAAYSCSRRRRRTRLLDTITHCRDSAVQTPRCVPIINQRNLSWLYSFLRLCLTTTLQTSVAINSSVRRPTSISHKMRLYIIHLQWDWSTENTPENCLLKCVFPPLYPQNWTCNEYCFSTAWSILWKGVSNSEKIAQRHSKQQLIACFCKHFSPSMPKQYCSYPILMTVINWIMTFLRSKLMLTRKPCHVK